jgi:hypothetical protein
MIIVDDRCLGLRVPPLLPQLPPKSGVSPPFAIGRPRYRGIAEIEFYFPPDQGLSVYWDAWAFGVLLLNFGVLRGGEVFAAVSAADRRRRIQEVLGRAPSDVGWDERPARAAGIGIPAFVGCFLKYLPDERTKLQDFDEAELLEQVAEEDQ